MYEDIAVGKYNPEYDLTSDVKVIICPCGHEYTMIYHRIQDIPMYCYSCEYKIGIDIINEFEVSTKRRTSNLQLERGSLTRFKRDALNFVGLTGHPKAEQAYYLARGQNHSRNLSGLLSMLLGLAEVVR